VIAEAHDHGPRVDVAERFEEHMHSLVVNELAEVDDGRPAAREEAGQALGVPLIRQPLVRVAGIRRIGPCLCEQPGERLLTRPRPPLVDVDSGWNFVHAVDVADNVLQYLADVRRANEDGRRARQRLPPPTGELRVAAQRVLELGAVRLDRVANAAGGPDRPSEEDVVAEDEVGGKALAHRGRIAPDPVVELRP
jgi:hypothetical protein